MIVDSSAIVAVLAAEADAASYAKAILDAHRCLLSAASYVEVSIVIDNSRHDHADALLDEFLAQSGIDIVPVTASQALLAREAYRRYGKGRRHPAQLNYGDSFAYALAKETGEALLFKGGDFALTDIKPAL